MPNVNVTAATPSGKEESFDFSMDEYIAMQEAIYGKPSNPAQPQKVVDSDSEYSATPIRVANIESEKANYSLFKEFEQQLAQRGLMIADTPSGLTIVDMPASYDSMRQNILSRCDGWAGNYNRPNLISWLGPTAQNEIMRCQQDPNRMIKWGIGIGAAGVGVGVLLACFYSAMKNKS